MHKYLLQISFRKISKEIFAYPKLNLAHSKVISAQIVRKLGQVCVNQYKLDKLGTVIKHIPGHGCASLDSHQKTPIVKLKHR